MLEIIAAHGGMSRVPELVTEGTLQALAEFGSMLTATMAHVQESSDHWMVYIDVPSMRLTFIPSDWLEMAVEKAIIDGTRLSVKLS